MRIIIACPDAPRIERAWRGCPGLTSFPLIGTSSGTNFNLAPYVRGTHATYTNHRWLRYSSRCLHLQSTARLRCRAWRHGSAGWQHSFHPRPTMSIWLAFPLVLLAFIVICYLGWRAGEYL